MKTVDILEWTMGWAWPILIVLVALLAWGVARIVTWDDGQGRSEERSSVASPGKGCVCTCS